MRLVFLYIFLLGSGLVSAQKIKSTTSLLQRLQGVWISDNLLRIEINQNHIKFEFASPGMDRGYDYCYEGEFQLKKDTIYTYSTDYWHKLRIVNDTLFVREKAAWPPEQSRKYVKMSLDISSSSKYDSVVTYYNSHTIKLSGDSLYYRSIDGKTYSEYNPRTSKRVNYLLSFFKEGGRSLDCREYRRSYGWRRYDPYELFIYAGKDIKRLFTGNAYSTEVYDLLVNKVERFYYERGRSYFKDSFFTGKHYVNISRCNDSTDNIFSGTIVKIDSLKKRNELLMAVLVDSFYTFKYPCEFMRKHKLVYFILSYGQAKELRPQQKGVFTLSIYNSKPDILQDRLYLQRFIPVDSTESLILKFTGEECKDRFRQHHMIRIPMKKSKRLFQRIRYRLFGPGDYKELKRLLRRFKRELN